MSVLRISGQPGTAVYGTEREWVNSTLTVTRLGLNGDDISRLKTGDCLLGSGDVEEYLTHPAVILSAFVAGQLIKSGESQSQTSPSVETATGSGSDWLIAHVVGVRSAEQGYRDATVTLEAVVDSTADDVVRPPAEMQIILPDSEQLASVAAGDVVEVVGSEGRYACGDACDARGFVASYLRKLEH